jgi:pilus assembly protein CpaD
MSSNRPLHLRLAPILAPLILAGLLGACASQPKDPKLASRDEPLTPTEQFPLKAVPTPGEIRLAAHPTGLSSAQREAVADLADHWLQDGGGPVTIRVPNPGADPRAADLTSRQAAALLSAMGVPDENIRRVGYDASGEGVAPIIVAYDTYQAVVPRCGTKWGNLSTNAKNKPYDNFGCAISANMAAEIADPADIAGPRTQDPADAGRRTTVIEKYRQGQPTAGAADANANGTISSLGGGGGSQ